MSDASEDLSSNESHASVLQIIDDIVATHINASDILVAVTTALSEVRSGTWVGTFMSKDLSTSLIASADRESPSMSDYVDGIVAAIDRPGRAPTMSLSQQVIESGRRVFLPDLPYEEFVSMLTPFEQAYLSNQPPPFVPESLGVLIVPMHARGSTIGSFGLFERDVSNPITEKDASWLQATADRIGMAIENAQVYQDAIMRLDRLRSIQSASRAISVSFDLAFTLKVILEQITGQLKVDAADVLLVDERDGTFALAASAGFMGRAIPDVRLPPDQGWHGGRVTHQHIETISSPSELSQARRRSFFAREGFKSYGTVALAPRGKLLGVIEFFHSSVLSPDEEWLSFLDAMACIAATAVDMAALIEEQKAASSNNPSARGRIKAPDLTKVEWEILKLLVEGETNRAISDQVHLSQNTIKFHVRQMLQKTGTTNRTDLTRQATQQGWL